MPKEVTGETFLTRLINRRRERVFVYEYTDPVPIEVLEPGETKVLESLPGSLYAPWSEIAWEENGSVHLVENREFVPVDYGKFELILLNEAGKQIEQITAAGQSLWCPRGIPVHISCPVYAPEIIYKELRLVRVEKMRRSLQVHGLWEFYDAFEWQGTDRTPKELREIEKELSKIEAGVEA